MGQISSPLLRIPAEIRESILKYIFIEPCQRILIQPDENRPGVWCFRSDSTSVRKNRTAALRTCRLVSEEALHLLYTRNTFFFRLREMGPASSKKNKTQNTFESFGSIIGEVNCQRLGTIAFTMTNTTVELLCDLKALGCQRIHAELLYLKNIGIKDDESVSLLKHQVTNVFRFRACLRKLIIGSFLDDASQFYGPRLPSNASSVALRTTFASDDEITEAGLCFSKQHQFRTSSCESAKNVILLGSNFFRMGQEAEILFLPHWLIMQGKRDWTRNFMDDPESEPFSDCKAWSSEGRAIPQLEMHVVFDKARKRLGE